MYWRALDGLGVCCSQNPRGGPEGCEKARARSAREHQADKATRMLHIHAHLQEEELWDKGCNQRLLGAKEEPRAQLSLPAAEGAAPP